MKITQSVKSAVNAYLMARTLDNTKIALMDLPEPVQNRIKELS